MKELFSYSSNSPQLVQSIGTVPNPLFQINFDIIEETREDMNSDTITQYKSHYVNVSKLEYSIIVSAIIQSRYTSSDIEAIVLNNMEAQDSSSSISDDKRSEYIYEYNELQTWRIHAKEIAQQAIV